MVSYEGELAVYKLVSNVFLILCSFTIRNIIEAIMRILKPIITLVFVGVLTLTNAYAQKEIFIKQIEFELEMVSDIDYENEYFLTIKLNKGSNYIFTITNNVNDRPGEAILELLEADNLILTNSVGEKYFTKISFSCNKTGFYDLLVRFRDNKLGYSMVDVTLIQ